MANENFSDDAQFFFHLQMYIYILYSGFAENESGVKTWFNTIALSPVVEPNAEWDMPYTIFLCVCTI